jgi:hypothetical protein
MEREEEQLYHCLRPLSGGETWKIRQGATQAVVG